MGRKAVHFGLIESKVVPAVFRFELKAGHLKWKVSDLIRATGASRSSVYYHLGRSKKEILNRSVSLFARKFYNLGDRRELTVEEFLPLVLKAREIMASNPDAKAFYYHWVYSRNSQYQKKFADFEAQYRAKLRINFPKLSKIEILELRLLILSLVLLPFLSKGEIQELLRRKIS